jgi:hypothetical protein
LCFALRSTERARGDQDHRQKDVYGTIFGHRGVERWAATGEASKWAVEAIIKDHEEEKYLLIHTVKRLECQTASASDTGEWDFPKGGLISPQEPRRSALLEVLREKTGSECYTILEEFEEKLTQELIQDESPSSMT